jgi:hypothetical protein
MTLANGRRKCFIIPGPASDPGRVASFGCAFVAEIGRPRE